MFLIVFITRYLDIFTNFHSVYNSIMKILYISCSAAIVYIISFKEPWKTTNDRSQDTFLHYKFAIVPCAVLALIINQKFTPMEVRADSAPGSTACLTSRLCPQILWTFSIYLEAVAIVPQLIVLQRFQEVENLTGNYVFLLGAYRAFYLLNWVYRAATETYYHHHWIVWISGLVQTALYVDFFYYYALRYVHLACADNDCADSPRYWCAANTTARKCRCRRKPALSGNSSCHIARERERCTTILSPPLQVAPPTTR